MQRFPSNQRPGPRGRTLEALPLPMRRSLLLVLALSASLGMGTAAARPDTGGRDIQDFAVANFRKTVAICVDAAASVRFFAGDNLQSPIGGGQPSAWSDTDITLEVIDTCAGGSEVVLWHLEGFSTVEDPDMERLEHASLDAAVTLSNGNGVSVDALIDLEWTGNDDAMVGIGHQLDIGYFRQERFETAQIAGSIAFLPSQVWPDGIVFTQDDPYDAAIGTANEISIP